MTKLSTQVLSALLILTVVLCFTACTQQDVQLDKQKVQFTLVPSASSGSVAEIDLPESANARISVASSSGVVVFSDHDIAVRKIDGVYITDAVDVIPGSYTITDFVIFDETMELYVAPKKDAELTASVADALPVNFAVDEMTATTVSLSVADVRDQDVRMFGYTSAKAKGNSLAIEVQQPSGNSLTAATAEIRQDKKLLGIFSLKASVNSIELSGDQKKPYTLTVYTANGASVRTFNVKDLKKEIGKNPLRVVLQPALVLTVESYVDVNNEYEEFFDFKMDGSGSVDINWGDGQQSTAKLPFEISHEYFTGNYTAIVTGDLKRVTDFAGFSYSTIINSITGLTNLTSLKVYDPSWGAVPIKVDLSNCKKLEKINVAKYGAPYEPCDLRTEFKLPTKHAITSFIFDAPSFDSNREFISAEELDVFVNNIYNNAVSRAIYNGKFFVNPVVTPSPATQQKLDILTNQYNWQVGFNDEIYNAYEFESGRARITTDTNTKREQWLRERFSDSDQIIARAADAPVLR